jgi:hypothetical protein
MRNINVVWWGNACMALVSKELLKVWHLSEWEVTQTLRFKEIYEFRDSLYACTMQRISEPSTSLHLAGLWHASNPYILHSQMFIYLTWTESEKMKVKMSREVYIYRECDPISFSVNTLSYIKPLLLLDSPTLTDIYLICSSNFGRLRW